MPERQDLSPSNLTRHVADPWRVKLFAGFLGSPARGYSALDLLKFYGMVVGLWFFMAWGQIHYLGLFDDLYNKPLAQQRSVLVFAALPLLFALPILLLFLWWAAGALVRYARWQLAQPALWRWFWLAILLFYGYVLLDPADSIHPQMSRKGLAPLVNINELVGNWDNLVRNHQLWPPPTFQFQWGYFLLWFLCWFLLLALHWSYISDFVREVWFYARRFQRYGVSILTGFRETERLARSVPVTRDYPRERPQLPAVYRGVPRLNVPGLTADEARAILAADSSGALLLAPRQDSVLFVDLGSYDFSPALGEVRRADGTPLLRFTDWWPLPETSREALVIPLAEGPASAVRSPEPELESPGPALTPDTGQRAPDSASTPDTASTPDPGGSP
jgi:hypothetical protein